MSSKEQEALGQHDVEAGKESGPPPYTHSHGLGNQGYSNVPVYTHQQYAEAQPMIVQPGYGQALAPGQPMVVIVNPVMTNPPLTYLTYSIIVTLFCCWPIGIFAILRAASCKSAIAQGNRDEAVRLSKEAKKLAMWALIVGIVFNILSIGIVMTLYAMYIIPSLNGEHVDW